MIPREALYRLLRKTYAALPAAASSTSDPAEMTFRHWVTDGFSLLPDLDLQDQGTVARILAGERWEDDGRHEASEDIARRRGGFTSVVIPGATPPGSCVRRCPVCGTSVQVGSDGLVPPHNVGTSGLPCLDGEGRSA